jgi:hypothetical protein
MENEEKQELSPLPPPKQKAKKRTMRRLPPLLRLTRRTVVFLSLTLIATILFFITGNRQTFLDSNLSMILRVVAANSIALSFFSLLATLQCIFFTFTNKRIRLVLHLVCYALVFIASTAVIFISLTINLLSEGIDF